jgi:hypothetical protein
MRVNGFFRGGTNLFGPNFERLPTSKGQGQHIEYLTIYALYGSYIVVVFVHNHTTSIEEKDIL